MVNYVEEFQTERIAKRVVKSTLKVRRCGNGKVAFKGT
jgi:hypothetical protein